MTRCVRAKVRNSQDRKQAGQRLLPREVEELTEQEGGGQRDSVLRRTLRV